MLSFEDRVKKVISSKLAIDVVKDDATFVDDLGADSLDMVEIVMGFEDEFDLEIPDSDIDQVKTVKDAIEYLKKRVYP